MGPRDKGNRPFLGPQSHPFSQNVELWQPQVFGFAIVDRGQEDNDGKRTEMVGTKMVQCLIQPSEVQAPCC